MAEKKTSATGKAFVMSSEVETYLNVCSKRFLDFARNDNKRCRYDPAYLRPHPILRPHLPLLRVLQGTARSRTNAAVLRSAAGRAGATRARSTHLRQAYGGQASPSIDDLPRWRHTERTDHTAIGIFAQRFSRPAPSLCGARGDL